MAAPNALEEIIRRDVCPQRDCMLTITDANGEAAFLYFKEGELIEANYAALWGKDALAQIVTWKLADRTVAPLPLGIKRSLWDRLEYPAQSRPVAHRQRQAAPPCRPSKLTQIGGARKPLRPLQGDAASAEDGPARKRQGNGPLRGPPESGESRKRPNG